MRNIVYLLFFSFIAASSIAQINPVSFNGHVKKIDSENYELIIFAELQPDWSLYSQKTPKGGPIPTQIKFGNTSDIQLLGKVKEFSRFRKVVNDKVFKLKLVKFYNHVAFKQRVKLKNKYIKEIQAEIDYMVCSSESCLPPVKKRLKFKL